MSEEFIKVTDTQTHRHTELLPELLVGAKNMSFQKRMVKKIRRRYKIEHVGMRHVSGGRREIPLIGARENKSFILLPLKISPFVAIFRGKQPDMFLFKCQRNYSDISVFV